MSFQVQKQRLKTLACVQYDLPPDVLVKEDISQVDQLTEFVLQFLDGGGRTLPPGLFKRKIFFSEKALNATKSFFSGKSVKVKALRLRFLSL